MPSKTKKGPSAPIRNHQDTPQRSITSALSSASAAASGGGSKSASIRTSALDAPVVLSSAYTDDQEEDDTDTSRSKPSHVWCANHEVTPDSLIDRTTVALVVTAQVFPKVKFVDRDTELAFTEDKKSLCQFVISRCNLHADIIVTDWWKQVQKYVAQTINRLRNDRNTAMKWAVLGNCHSMM
jgi:hypothetical protein